jgi:hypothetical protein
LTHGSKGAKQKGAKAQKKSRKMAWLLIHNTGEVQTIHMDKRQLIQVRKQQHNTRRACDVLDSEAASQRKATVMRYNTHLVEPLHAALQAAGVSAADTVTCTAASGAATAGHQASYCLLTPWRIDYANNSTSTSSWHAVCSAFAAGLQLLRLLAQLQLQAATTLVALAAQPPAVAVQIKSPA